LQPRYAFDAQYLQRLAQGDAEVEHHFARYFGDLIRLKARARLRSQTGADDVCQETLLRVLRNVRKGGVEHPERLGAYVNTVSNHVLLELFRRDKRDSPMPEDEPIASADISAEAELVLRERQNLVREALEELSPKERELLRRVVLEEQDKDRICKEMGVTREYLRVLVHRAMEKLRAVLTKKRAAGM
jgi:RNA polymerase sigma-70 factor, ECF subfamily